MLKLLNWQLWNDLATICSFLNNGYSKPIEQEDAALVLYRNKTSRITHVSK